MYLLPDSSGARASMAGAPDLFNRPAISHDKPGSLMHRYALMKIPRIIDKAKPPSLCSNIA
jgi:hypothetical protein